MFLGDAGQNLYEEVDVVVKGGNYGWNVKEATSCFNAANELVELSSCPSFDAFGNVLIDPVIEANNVANPEGGNFLTVVGGNVYRGHSIPGMQGKYLFANFSSSFTSAKGELYVTNPAGTGLWAYQKLPLKSFPDNLGNFVKGFGQDLSGELYVLGSAMLGPSGTAGKVFKLVLSE
jgi:hypothetical protein